MRDIEKHDRQFLDDCENCGYFLPVDSEKLCAECCEEMQQYNKSPD